MEEDRRNTIKDKLNGDISIHFLAWRKTYTFTQLYYILCDFNPLPRMEEDTASFSFH